MQEEEKMIRCFSGGALRFCEGGREEGGTEGGSLAWENARGDMRGGQNLSCSAGGGKPS